MQWRMAELKAPRDSTLKAQRHSLLLPSEYPSGDGGGGKRSFLKYLRAKPWKRKTHSVSSLEKDRSSSTINDTPTDPLKVQNSDHIRVLATALHPQVHYEILPITPNTTAYEVIVALVDKYATSTEDKSPDVFYLTETQESDKGSYSRVLEGSDRVHNIQQRWRDEKKSWFTLCRTPKVVQEDSLLGSPASPVSLFSPSDENNNYVVLVEEGCGSSPTLSDLMSDSYFSTTASESSRVSPARTNTSESNTAENSPNEVLSISTSGNTLGSDSKSVVDNTMGILVDEMSSRSSLRTNSTSTQLSGCDLFGSHDDCRSPDSLLNSSSYTCSTESMGHSDPFDNSQDNPTDTASSVFSRANCLTQRRFSSPESYSFRRETRMAVKKTGARVRFRDQVSPGTASTNSITSPWHNTNVAMATETNHIALRSKRRHFSDSGSPMGPRESQERGIKLSVLMQKSLDKGMSGMMNKVINEQRQRQRSWANTEGEPQSRLKPIVATSPIIREGVVLQPLVCSPVLSEERKYPQFVFAPPVVQEGETGEIDGGEDGGKFEAIRESSALDENVNRLEKYVVNGVGSRKLALDLSRLAEENAMEERLKEVAKHQTEVEDEGEPSTGVDHEREDTRPPDQQCSHLELPCNYHRTLKAIPAVLVESELTIHPTFQTRASLYPSFLHCDYFSSEMDLLESLSTLMDIKLEQSKPKPYKRGQTFSTDKQNLTDIDSLALSPRRKPLVPDHKGSLTLLPPRASLISPSRRSRLIGQAAQAVNLKRPHSFSVRQDHSATHDKPFSLVSPARRDRLIQQAALALRSKYQASKQHQLGEESHPGVQEGQTDEISEPLPTTNPRLDEGMLQRETRCPDGDLKTNTVSPEPTPGVTIGRPTNTQLLSLRPPTTSGYNPPLTGIQSHSNRPTSRPSRAIYSDTHRCFSAADLTVNLHQRQLSFSDSVSDSSSSLAMRRSRSATPSWSHGSVETIATVPSELQPPRCLSNSHTPLTTISHQKSHTFPHYTHTQKSLSYLSVLQQVEKAATRKHYSTESANLGLRQNLKGFKSVEVLDTGTQREILYTLGPQRRPVTVIVSNKATSKSTLSLSNPHSLPSHLKRTTAQGYPKFSSTQHLAVTKLPTIY